MNRLPKNFNSIYTFEGIYYDGYNDTTTHLYKGRFGKSYSRKIKPRKHKHKKNKGE